MKLLFIEAKKKLEKLNTDNANIENINFSILPDKLFLAYSIQYKELAEKVKRELKKKGNKIIGFKQVLGCSKLKSNCPILLIGSGKFHAIQLALQDNEVFILENKIKKLDKNEIKKAKTKRKSALSRFLAAETIGILVSSKPGQENLDKALDLKKELEKKDKEAFVFLADNINLDELENYNMDSWVNTACPALSLDSRIVNLDELP